MPDSTLTVNDFQKLVRDQTNKVAAEMGWSYSNSAERGYAFQLWCARLISAFETTLETDPVDSMLYSRDLGADLFFEDTAAGHIVICQCKYQSFDKPINEDEIMAFFNKHDHFLQRKWVQDHGGKDAAATLEDYGERFADGYSASYYFISTGKATDRLRGAVDAINSAFADKRVSVTCDLLDQTGLKEYYIRAQSLEASIPPRVEIDLPVDQFFTKAKPRKTLVACLKGNTLRDLSKRYKQSLYAFNIRGYLGSRGINKAIRTTATEEPDLFFYFNNGVSAICTDFEVTENHLEAFNFQIINGAQTVSSLASQAPNPEIEVLFRLTKTENVKTEKGLNRKIIEFNNSQNVVKISDFRSNDEIQVSLERRLSEVHPKGKLPKIVYIRKRGTAAKGTGYNVRLEDFAKIRFAFLHEPTLIHASPKALWTPRDEGGQYEKSFGVRGELKPDWNDEILDEALLAVVLYKAIDDKLKESAKRDPESRFLRRLRFHALALSGEYLRKLSRQSDYHKLTRNDGAFQQLWNDFWALANPTLINSFLSASRNGTTMFAFVRSETVWQDMQKSLRIQLSAR